jgi:acetyl esterase/lipase
MKNTPEIENIPNGVKFIPNIPYRKGNDAWKLDLAMPKELGDTPRPAIVFIHGGGWRNGDKLSPNFLQPTLDYATKNYVCITINYRVLDEAPITACVEDVKNAVRWVRAHAETYHVDPNRIGATGNSAGAHLSAMLGLCPPSAGLEGNGPYQEHSSMIQAIVSSATPTNFLVPMSDREGKGESPRNPGPNSWRLEPEEIRAKVSPMTYINADTPPILLIHEASDQTVGVYHSDNFIKALRKAGAKDVNYILLGDNSGHGTFGRNIAFTEPARGAFFNRVLKSEE